MGSFLESNNLPVVNRHQEYIDHTLLPQEYIRESNNFLIDLIDHPVSFEKPGNVGSIETVSRPDEMQFQSSIFHFVNKPLPNVAQNIDGLSKTNEATLPPLSDPHPMIMQTVEDESSSFNQFSTLSLLSDAREPMVEAEPTVLRDGNVIYVRSNIARKVLPHKKRISRKLKANEGEIEIAPALQAEQPKPDDRTGMVQPQFSCEICSHTSSTQLEFFAHLKLHYEPEPASPDALIATSRLETLQEEKPSSDICLLSKKDVTSVNPVFLNFDDFARSITSEATSNRQNDDIKILNSNSMDKCINYVVAQTEPKLLKDMATEETTEFSDAEDMLEGIRNVVDKVSIEEDDDLETLTPRNEQSHWYDSGNCNNTGPIFKSELQLPPPLDEMLTVQAEDLSNHTKAMNDSVMQSTDCMSFSSEHDAKVFPNIHSAKELTYDAAQSDCGDRAESSAEGATRSSTRQPTSAVSEQDCPVQLTSTEDNKVLRKKKQYFCTKCDRSFNSLNALKYHDRTHAGVRDHKCEICNRAFLAQGQLKAHLRIHSTDKPFECELCQRKFRQLGDLKYHTISIHTDEKNYQCEFCGKAFARKYSLSLHRRIHTSERPHQCEHCGKSFRARSYLDDHLKIHTGERPHVCKVCSKRFRVHGDLKRHLQIHKKKPPKEPTLDAK